MYKAISEEFLNRLPGWNISIPSCNPRLHRDILFSLGIDISEDVEQQVGLQYRNEFGQLDTKPRWIGLERTDRQWLNSSYSSLEAHYHSADFGLKNDMKNLLKTNADNPPFQKQDSEELGLFLEQQNKLREKL